MPTQRVTLSRLDWARHFGPVLFCGWIVVSSAAMVILSRFVTLTNPNALVPAGLLGCLLAGSLGAAMLANQLRELRFTRWPTVSTDEANFRAVLTLGEQLGWRVTAQDRPHRTEMCTSNTVLDRGEIVHARFQDGWVFVACLCDPGVGFSLSGSRRCAQHRDHVRLAVQRPEGPPPAAAPDSI